MDSVSLGMEMQSSPAFKECWTLNLLLFFFSLSVFNKSFLIVLACYTSTKAYPGEPSAQNPSPSRMCFCKNVLEKVTVWFISIKGLPSDPVQWNRTVYDENIEVGTRHAWGSSGGASTLIEQRGLPGQRSSHQGSPGGLLPKP